MKKTVFQVGDKVRFSSRFLKNTGQIKGRACFDKWEVLDIDGDYLTLNEAVEPFGISKEEFATLDATTQFRVSHLRVAAANMVHVGKPDRTNI